MFCFHSASFFLFLSLPLRNKGANLWSVIIYNKFPLNFIVVFFISFWNSDLPEFPEYDLLLMGSAVSWLILLVVDIMLFPNENNCFWILWTLLDSMGTASTQLNTCWTSKYYTLCSRVSWESSLQVSSSSSFYHECSQDSLCPSSSRHEAQVT